MSFMCSYRKVDKDNGIDPHYAMLAAIPRLANLRLDGIDFWDGAAIRRLCCDVIPALSVSSHSAAARQRWDPLLAHALASTGWHWQLRLGRVGWPDLAYADLTNEEGPAHY